MQLQIQPPLRNQVGQLCGYQFPNMATGAPGERYMLFRSAVLFIIAGSVEGKRDNRLSCHEKRQVDAAVLIVGLLYREDSGERTSTCK